MPFEDARSHLDDILESIRLVEQFVAGMDLEAYGRDEKTQAAVERKMLIISEAAVRLKEDAEPSLSRSPMARHSRERQLAAASVRQRGH